MKLVKGYDMKHLALSVCALAFLGLPVVHAAIAVSGTLSHQAANLALEACGLSDIEDDTKAQSPSGMNISDLGVVQNFRKIAKHCDPTLDLPALALPLGTIAGFDGSTYSRIVSAFNACGITREELQAGGGVAIFDVYTLKAAILIERHCWKEHSKRLQE